MSDSTKPFRVAVVGLGWAGVHHIKLYKQIPGAEVIAIGDTNESLLNKVKEEHGIPWAFNDYRTMLKELPEIQAVDVCTPNGMHARNSIDALEAGKHVLVEKPMAMSSREARQMVDAASKAGKQLVVGFQHRFDPKSKLIHDRVDHGEFGKILYVRAQWLRRRGIPSWGVFGRKDLQGGGPMIDIGVHVLEAAHYMMGSPRPVAATAATYTYLGDKPCAAAAPWGPWDHKSYTVEDLAVGMIRFDTGAMLTIETSFAAHIEQEEMNITVMGEKAGANWNTSKIFKDESGYMMTSKAEFLGSWDHFEYKMRHFVEVCRDDRPNEVPAEHALEVQKMIDAIYASAEQKKEVVIE